MGYSTSTTVSSGRCEAAFDDAGRPDIAALIATATRRRETTVRWYPRRTFAKRRVWRQADVVRLLLSLPDVAPPPH